MVTRAARPRALTPAILLAGALVLLLAPTAQALTPTIENTGSNMFEQTVGSREDGNSANRLDINVVVKHDVGKKVTGLKVDTDYNTTDNSSTATTQTADVANQPTVVGGFNYTTAFLSFRNTVNNIACGDRPGFSHTIYVRPVLSDGTVGNSSSASIFFTPAGGCTIYEDYPYMYGQTNTSPVQLTPGGTATFSWNQDDPDSGNNTQGYAYRFRRLNDGATTGLTVVCPVDIDNELQTRTFTFPNQRGHWVVEAELREGSGCTDQVSLGGKFWRIGSADVNTAQASSPALSLSATRPQVNGSTTVTATTDDADDSANGGAPQYIEWDLDNNGTYDDANLGTGVLTGAGDDSDALTSTEKQTTINTTGKAPGTYTVKARVTDNGAMNASDAIRRQTTATTTYVVDSPPVLSAPSSVSTDAGSPVDIALSATDANGDTLTFSTTSGPTNGSGALSGSGNSRTYTYTPNAGYAGPDSITFRVDDGFGGSDSKTVAISVYPTTTIDSGPSGLTNNKSPTFTYSSQSGATFQCQLDGGGFASCPSEGKSYSNLEDGQHTFAVRAVSATGNLVDQSPASRTFTVDATAPETSIDSKPSDPTNDSTPTFEFSSDDANASFECRLYASDDTAPDFGACSGPGASHTSYELANERYTFEVRASDNAGNTDQSPASYSFTVDTRDPETTIGSKPSDPTNDPTPTFEFSSDDPNAAFECRLYASDDTAPDFGACSGPGKSHTSGQLDDGRYTFEVRATDQAGNTDDTPATYSFTVDTQPPETTITAAPPPISDSGSVRFEFSSSESGSTFECRLDSSEEAAFSPCESPKTYSVSNGNHKFEVRAVDGAGNRDPSPASSTFIVADTTPPDTEIDSAPDHRTNDTSPRFTFTSSDTGATFECKLAGPGHTEDFDACSSPKDYTGLQAGDYTFSVRARDGAGNTDQTPATWDFAVDTQAPETTIDSGPTGPDNSTSASFTFSSDDPNASFECRLAGPGHTEDFGSCPSPQGYSGLGDGDYTFSVRATDQATNTDQTPATRSFTVDTAPPETTIGSGRNGRGNSTSASFSFSSDDPNATFTCKLAGPGHTGDFGNCGSYSNLADGDYTFSVRATDLAGNTDQSPATRSFTVDTAPPETTIDSGRSGRGNGTSASFTFSSSDPNASFACKLAGPGHTQDFAPCPPQPYSNLGDGDYTFFVRATDQVGNIDQTPATRSFTVDTQAPDTTIDSRPSDPTTDASPRFAFSSESGASFECQLEGPGQSPGFSACESPRGYAGLADGRYTFSVRARDAAGNTDATPASHAFTIQRQATGQPDPDRDADGVPDARDRCPDQPAGTVDGCPSQPVDRKAPVPTFPASDRSITVASNGTFTFSIGGCSEVATCNGSVTFSSVTQSRSARTRRLAFKRFQLRPGRRANLKLRLRGPDLRRLRKQKRMRVRATVVLRDRAGNSSRRRYTLTLRAPRRR